MTKSDQLLAYAQGIVKERLEKLEYLTELEKLGFLLSIRNIFEKNEELEAAYYELLDYFEAQKELGNFISKVEMYYQYSLSN